MLIPRPETEGLIEAVNRAMLPDREAPLRVADVCTGSGCVAVAIARERRSARVVATDISAARWTSRAATSRVTACAIASNASQGDLLDAAERSAST